MELLGTPYESSSKTGNTCTHGQAGLSVVDEPHDRCCPRVRHGQRWPQLCTHTVRGTISRRGLMHADDAFDRKVQELNHYFQLAAQPRCLTARPCRTTGAA
jgi:hypothetical protein